MKCHLPIEPLELKHLFIWGVVGYQSRVEDPWTGFIPAASLTRRRMKIWKRRNSWRQRCEEMFQTERPVSDLEATPPFFFPFSVVFLADRTSPQNEQVLVFQTAVIWKAQDLSWA